jgi:hypothetical protein
MICFDDAAILAGYQSQSASLSLASPVGSEGEFRLCPNLAIKRTFGVKKACLITVKSLNLNRAATRGA